MSGHTLHLVYCMFVYAALWRVKPYCRRSYEIWVQSCYDLAKILAGSCKISHDLTKILARSLGLVRSVMILAISWLNPARSCDILARSCQMQKLIRSGKQSNKKVFWHINTSIFQVGMLRFFPRGMKMWELHHMQSTIPIMVTHTAARDKTQKHWMLEPQSKNCAHWANRKVNWILYWRTNSMRMPASWWTNQAARHQMNPIALGKLLLLMATMPLSWVSQVAILMTIRVAQLPDVMMGTQ